MPLSTYQALHKKVNLLIIDDDENIIDTLIDMFVSPLFAIQAANTTDNALAHIHRRDIAWHCWILDMAMEKEDSGLTMIKSSPNYPFIIVLSGLGSMSVAHQASQLGAKIILDKVPSTLTTLLPHVAQTAALGYALGGKMTQQYDLFCLLKENQFKRLEDWSEKCRISLRQLQRILQTHTALNAREFMATYYALSFMLSRTQNEVERLVAEKSPEHAFYIEEIRILEWFLDRKESASS